MGFLGYLPCPSLLGQVWEYTNQGMSGIGFIFYNLNQVWAGIGFCNYSPRPAYNIPIKTPINISLHFQDFIIFSIVETVFSLFLFLTLGLFGVDFSHKCRAQPKSHPLQWLSSFLLSSSLHSTTFLFNLVMPYLRFFMAPTLHSTSM